MFHAKMLCFLTSADRRAVEAALAMHDQDIRLVGARRSTRYRGNRLEQPLQFAAQQQIIPAYTILNEYHMQPNDDGLASHFK